MNRSDPGRLAQAQDMTERRVVAEIEPEARGVDEDELAGDPELEISFVSPHLLGDLREIHERLLNGAVLQRIELYRPQTRVKRDHEIAAAAAHARSRFPVVAPAFASRARVDHAGALLIARLTALRTIT